MVKIVVLDGFTANPGDLSWVKLQSLGDCTIYDRTSPEQLIERSYDAQVIITNKVIIDAKVMAHLPNLRYIGVTATGYNVVDTAEAKNRGIVVTNVPAYSTDSVAQLAFGLILELAGKTGKYSHEVHLGRWEKSPDFTFSLGSTLELAGKTLGIFGYGNIGKRVVEIGAAFGMKIIAFSRNRVAARQKHDDKRVDFVSLEELFKQSDFLSLHAPLTPETANIVNAVTLKLAKPTLYIINTARGGLIDEIALADALNSAQIAGAGLDVLSTEPPLPDNPLLTAANCVITPHVAWATLEARRRLITVVADNVGAFLSGTPVNRVN